MSRDLHCIVAFCACFRLALGFASWFCFLCFGVFLDGVWLEKLWMEVWRKAKGARKRGKGRAPILPCRGHDIQLVAHDILPGNNMFKVVSKPHHVVGTTPLHHAHENCNRKSQSQCRALSNPMSWARHQIKEATRNNVVAMSWNVVGTTSKTLSTTFLFSARSCTVLLFPRACSVDF